MMGMTRMLHDVEHVKLGGWCCPFCRSKNILAIEQIQDHGDSADCQVECHDCGELWRDHYRLVGYTPDEEAKAKEKEHNEEEENHRCENCGARWMQHKLTNPVPRIFQRVAPGEPMPSGECPDCGALCHQD